MPVCGIHSVPASFCMRIRSARSAGQKGQKSKVARHWQIISRSPSHIRATTPPSRLRFPASRLRLPGVLCEYPPDSLKVPVAIPGVRL